MWCENNNGDIVRGLPTEVNVDTASDHRKEGMRWNLKCPVEI